MKIVKVGAMWCPACIITNKYWKDLKNKYSSIEFLDYDLDMDEEEVKPLKIGNKLPEIIIYDDNNVEIKRIIGEKTQEEMEKELLAYNEKA
jgi:thiol-disulfide isomerase/thioredoxin